MQRDSATYCDEPEDDDDFSNFKSSFNIESKQTEINDLVKVQIIPPNPCLVLLSHIIYHW